MLRPLYLLICLSSFLLFKQINGLSIPWIPFSASRIWSLSQAQQHLASYTSSDVQFQHDKELLYHVDGYPYFSPNQPVTSLPATLWPAKQSSPQLVTVINLSGTKHDETSLLDTVKHYLATDDVLTAHWLKNLVVVPDLTTTVQSTSNLELSSDALSTLRKELGIERIIFSSSIRLLGLTTYSTMDLQVLTVHGVPHNLRGPYLIKNSESSGTVDFLPVYKLHSDIYRTFVFGIYPTLSGSYNALRLVDDRGYNYIPVPSKLYSRCENDAVCGQRIAVKDIYQIKGVKTASGSRIYGDIYGPANETAFAVQKVLGLGGILVGKTKTAAFAIGSIGNDDTFDEQYPWSPREDLWQTCAGSSSGSACAMAAYDWLDFALGSDTGGSVRGPAAVAGLYGNRPSTGAISLEGVTPLIELFDSAGVLARDPLKWTKFIRSWYQYSPLNFKEYNVFPRNIVYHEGYFDNSTDEARNLTFSFIAAVEESLGSQAHAINLEKGFNETFKLANMTLDGLKNNSELVESWSWNKVGKDFYARYQEQNGGRNPPIDPSPRDIWRNTSRFDFSMYAEAREKIVTLGQAVNDVILGQDEVTCSQSILVYDIGSKGKPLYRESKLDKPTGGEVAGVTLNSLCPAAGCVDITLPIGQSPYLSPISGIEEMHPVTVSLIARRGCDLMMMSLVERLAERGLLVPVKTGRTAF